MFKEPLKVGKGVPDIATLLRVFFACNCIRRTLVDRTVDSGGSSNPLCSEKWTQYALSCYYLSSDSKPWNFSKKDCEDKEAHLIVINSEEEMNFLCSIAKGKFLWIGLTDQDGTWTWVDGTPYDTTPKFWGKGQPDDYKGHGYGGGEDCAALRPTNDWNDGHCSRKYPYVCEKKILF
ncbi:asialoglycoprotein receptor 1-like [Aquarana catesbeiana]|uniref:asialoglycoprotein receptor 1-like n=1 Tax=Aquarana catesbeiana TaxID=8400 RepID=UPI003CCA6A77